MTFIPLVFARVRTNSGVLRVVRTECGARRESPPSPTICGRITAFACQQGAEKTRTGGSFRQKGPPTAFGLATFECTLMTDANAREWTLWDFIASGCGEI